MRVLEQLRCLDDQRVEVRKIAGVKEPLILVEEREVVVMLEVIAPKAVGGKARERAPVPAPRPLEPLLKNLLRTL